MDFNVRKKTKESEDPQAYEGHPLVEEGRSIMRVDIAKERFKIEIARLDLSIKEAEEIAVVDDQTHKLAISKAGELKKLVKAFEERRKEVIGPADTFVREVNKFCKIIKDRAQAALSVYNQKVSTYSAKLEAERREREAKQKSEAEALQRKLDEEAEKGGYEAPKVEIAPIKQETVTRTEDGISAHTRKVWAFEVEDFSKVPDGYKMIDERKINADIRAGILEIPGLRIFQKETTIFRT